MIIELLGTPGAGKTSLVPAVRQFFNQQGKQAFTIVEAARPVTRRTRLGKLVDRLVPGSLRRSLLWQFFYGYSRYYRRRFAGQYPHLMEGVIAYQQQRPLLREDRQHVLGWFTHLTGTYAFLKAHLWPDDVLIIDEGFVHRVVQLFASEAEEPDLEQVRRYLDQVPRPDLVIYITAPLEHSVERVFSRGLWKRFEVKSRADTLLFLSRADVIVQAAAEHLDSLGWPVVRVFNGSRELEQTHRELRSLLAAWINSNGMNE